MLKKGKCSVFFLILGLLCILLALLVYFGGSKIIDNKIEEFSVITISNSEKWAKPPAVVYRKYYFFEVLNADELATGNTTIPIVTERGPYVYEEVLEKRKIKFWFDSLVTYTPVFYLYFKPELSVGNDSDTFMFLNIPLLAMNQKINSNEIKLGPIQLFAINNKIKENNVSIFSNRSVSDLVNGYTDTLIELISGVKPGLLKNNTFSLLNGKNGTENEIFTIFTGYEYLKNLGKILDWNNQRRLPFWYSDQANAINGSDGVLFGPDRKKRESLDVFNPDMCRSFTINHYQESKIDGIDTYDYFIQKDVFSNSSNNPANKGFCDPNINDCSKNGIFNTSNCNPIPIILSQPHFLNADKEIIDSVEGIFPNEKLHDSFLNIQPQIGIPVAGSIRLQFNFKLEKSMKLNIFKNVSEVLLPVGWFEKKVGLNDETLSLLRLISKLPKWLTIFMIVFVTIGVVWLFISFYLAWTVFKTPKEQISSKKYIPTYEMKEEF